MTVESFTVTVRNDHDITLKTVHSDSTRAFDEGGTTFAAKLK
jgi:hypothetical protein